MTQTTPADTPKERKALRVVSFDGGGIRGLSALLLLRAFLYLVQRKGRRKTMPLPSEYFSMIGGTSTGGIIAIMLGPLRMSVVDAITAYTELVTEVFSCPAPGEHTEAMLMASKLEAFMKRLVKSRMEREDAPLLNEACCKTFVCTMNAKNMNARIPHLLRTYDCNEYPTECTIWEAARATSARAGFFQSMVIRGQTYVDGAIANNNPTELLLKEAQSIFPDHPIATVLSFGTGKRVTIELPPTGRIRTGVIPPALVTTMEQIATDCENTHEKIASEFYSKNQPNVYFRFNVEQGMQSVSLDQWERLDEVETHTVQYTKDADVKARLDRAVEVVESQAGIVLADFQTNLR